MCKGGNKFDVKDFQRNIITQTLHKKARVKLIKRGGRNLRDEEGVLDLEEIQDGIDAEMQLKHGNSCHTSNNFKNNNDDASTHNNDGHNKNICRKKGHNHEWIYCTDNPNSKNYKGGNNRQRGDE